MPVNRGNRTFGPCTRCSTDEQDLTAQRGILLELGVAEDRIYLDHGLTGTRRARPGLDQALAAVRAISRGAFSRATLRVRTRPPAQVAAGPAVPGL
jgi:hypothetical protein